MSALRPCAATAHTLIGRGYIASGKRLSVSTQQLTSCTPNPRHCGGTGGCSGATFQLAADYIARAGALTSDDVYPYTSGTTSETGECKYDPLSMPPVLTLKGYTQLSSNNKTEALAAIAKGPVSISVAASKWFLYGGGVFDGCTTAGDAISTFHLCYNTLSLKS